MGERSTHYMAVTAKYLATPSHIRQRVLPQQLATLVQAVLNDEHSRLNRLQFVHAARTDGSKPRVTLTRAR